MHERVLSKGAVAVDAALVDNDMTGVRWVSMSRNILLSADVTTNEGLGSGCLASRLLIEPFLQTLASFSREAGHACIGVWTCTLYTLLVSKRLATSSQSNPLHPGTGRTMQDE